jgi:BirA family transcriptional regulator, biotin operon repressor / biotin---[acetyl-CoA-carboxylase] ligase
VEGVERPPIDADALRRALGQRWARIVVVDEDESTNATLLHDVTAPDRAVLVAEHQHAGRGRLDRTWISPARAGLTFSVALRPDAPIRTWGWLPLLTGVAVREALVETTGCELALKWPNDVLYSPSEGKLAGILAQTSGEAVVIGVGLNVTTTEEELPVETATSLQLCGARTLDRTELLVAILRRLDGRLAQWSDVAGDAEACGLAAAYRTACATLGRAVSVSTTAGPVVTGRAVGIDHDGRLQVEHDGLVEVVGAGDVEHLRSSP